MQGRGAADAAGGRDAAESRTPAAPLDPPGGSAAAAGDAALGADRPLAGAPPAPVPVRCSPADSAAKLSRHDHSDSRDLYSKQHLACTRGKPVCYRATLCLPRRSVCIWYWVFFASTSAVLAGRREFGRASPQYIRRASVMSLPCCCRGPPGELAAAARPESVPRADFDFEAALSKFNKADVEKETEQVPPSNPRQLMRCGCALTTASH